MIFVFVDFDLVQRKRRKVAGWPAWWSRRRIVGHPERAGGGHEGRGRHGRPLAIAGEWRRLGDGRWWKCLRSRGDNRTWPCNAEQRLGRKVAGGRELRGGRMQ